MSTTNCPLPYKQLPHHTGKLAPNCSGDWDTEHQSTQVTLAGILLHCSFVFRLPEHYIPVMIPDTLQDIGHTTLA